MGERTWQQLCDSERETLLRYLDKMRAAIIRATDGLDDEELRRPGVPSGTNLLGLVHHVTGVEQHWFQYVFAGLDDEPDMGMTAPADRLGRRGRLALPGGLAPQQRDRARACDDLSTMAARPNPGEDDLDSFASSPPTCWRRRHAMPGTPTSFASRSTAGSTTDRSVVTCDKQTEEHRDQRR